MSTNKTKRATKGSQKTVSTRRTMNPPRGRAINKGEQGDPRASQQHDIARRQGSFEGKGNHARTGNRGHQ